jgi:predicted DNA-binding protein
MAKKKQEAKEVPATAEPITRHARIELPDEVYQRLKKVADRALLPVAAYIRQAVLEKIQEDEERAGGRR